MGSRLYDWKDAGYVLLDLRSSSRAAARSTDVEAGVAPGPMKPSPPALETARARSGPAITRIGAPMMKGRVIHGNASLKRRVARVDAMAVFAMFILCLRMKLCLFRSYKSRISKASFVING